MIDWVNSHGGVAGRKLSPIYYGFDASGTGPPSDQQDQAACAKYTQDNKVFAMIVQGSIFDECAKREGAVDLNQDGTPSIYKKYPDRIDIESLNMVRAWKVTVDGAAQLGYFNAGAKIGVSKRTVVPSRTKGGAEGASAWAGGPNCRQASSTASRGIGGGSSSPRSAKSAQAR